MIKAMASTNRSSVFMAIILLGCVVSSAIGGPIPPGPTGSFINNSAAPQTSSQFNVSSGTVRGKLTVGDLAASSFSVSGPITSSFIGSGAGLTDIPWAGVIKTGSDLSDLTVKDHSVLSSTGTLTHAELDSHVAATSGIHGATSAGVPSKIVIRDSTGSFSANEIVATTFIGAVQGNAASATTAVNLAGGTTGQIPYQTGEGVTGMMPFGNYNWVLQGQGSLMPTWTSSPTITGSNITAIPLTALSPGILSNFVAASSITVTGVTPGVYGGATRSNQITVGVDGRISSIHQFVIPGASTNTVTDDGSYSWSKYQNFESSVSIQGGIYGDGSHLTGVIASTTSHPFYSGMYGLNDVLYSYTPSVDVALSSLAVIVKDPGAGSAASSTLTCGYGGQTISVVVYSTSTIGERIQSSGTAAITAGQEVTCSFTATTQIYTPVVWAEFLENVSN